jgi:hypothetical protein
MDRLKAALMERCRSLHIEPPTQDRIDRLVRPAIHQHEERFCEALLTRLPVGTQARLDALLLPSEHFSYEKGQEPGRSLLQELRADPGRSQGLLRSNRGQTRHHDICTRVNVGIEVAVVVFNFLLLMRILLPMRNAFDRFLVCRVSSRCPNTSRLTRRVAKHQKLLSVLGSIRKTDSHFFAASIGLRIETTDFYLIRARKMA